MPIEIAVPFRLDSKNRVAVESSPDGQIRQHVSSLVNTETGERVMLPEYGIPLSSLLFEMDDTMLLVNMTEDVSDSFRRWEPGVMLSRVMPKNSSQQDGLVELDVEYMRTEAATSPVPGRNTNFAVITPGGRVSEVIRG